MRELRKIIVVSIFTLAVIAIGFFLYPLIEQLVANLNGNYAYFVPSRFVQPISAVIDLSAACLLTAGLFYGAIQMRMRRRPTRKIVRSTGTPPQQTEPKDGETHSKQRFWLIPIWFVIQFFYEIPGAWATDHSSLSSVVLRAISAQTSLNALWLSFLVILGVIFYKKVRTTKP